MSYLARLKKNSESHHVTNQQNQQNLAKAGFAGFAGSVTSDFQKKTTAAIKLTSATDATPSTKVSGWVLHFSDRDPTEVWVSPAPDHAEALALYPAAIAAQPFTPPIREPVVPMTAVDEAAIRAWLALIEETDPATITGVIGQCQRDADAREYFTGRAEVELPKPDPFDDRRTCSQCSNLIGRRCQAARRGEIAASRSYEPIRDMLQRCEGYAPGPADADRRSGSERWPGLISAQKQP